MKILITGSPGSGKSIFSNYLHSKLKDFFIIEFDECLSDLSVFQARVLNSQNSIVVVQDKYLISFDFVFDREYVCSRHSHKIFSVTDGFISQAFTFREMKKYFDPRLDFLNGF